MTDDHHEAELLCRGSELQLYLESCDPWIQESGAERIRQSKRRALRLALLWHAEVASGQNDARVHRRTTKAHLANGSVAAHRKARLFDQIARRFTSRLDVLSDASHQGKGYPAAMGTGTPPQKRGIPWMLTALEKRPVLVHKTLRRFVTNTAPENQAET